VITFTVSSIGRSVGIGSFSPDGRLLAVRDNIGVLTLHDTATGRQLMVKRVGVNRSFGFWGGPGRRTLFAYSYHQGLLPLGPDLKEHRPALDGSKELIEPAFSPDGTRAISKFRGFRGSSLTGHTVSGDSVAKAWVRRPTDPVGKLTGVMPLLFLPDGERFLVWSSEVDRASRKRLMLCRWSNKADRVSCELPSGFSVAVVSPDGGLLLCSNYESGTVLVFRTADLAQAPEEYPVPKRARLQVGRTTLRGRSWPPPAGRT
jgi:hypothetical protein